jgi:hypothetical protein
MSRRDDLIGQREAQIMDGVAAPHPADICLLAGGLACGVGALTAMPLLLLAGGAMFVTALLLALMVQVGTRKSAEVTVDDYLAGRPQSSTTHYGIGCVMLIIGIIICLALTGALVGVGMALEGM